MHHSILVFIVSFELKELQAPQVEHTNTSILATTNEDICGISTKSYVVDFLVVCDKLGLRGQGRNIPNGTGGVDA